MSDVIKQPAVLADGEARALARCADGIAKLGERAEAALLQAPPAAAVRATVLGGELCGCGRPADYTANDGGWCCNKYGIRCKQAQPAAAVPVRESCGFTALAKIEHAAKRHVTREYREAVLTEDECRALLEHFDRMARQAPPAAAVTSEYVLPCDVRLPPSTIIAAGCPISTLISAMELRRESGVTSFPAKGPPTAVVPASLHEAPPMPVHLVGSMPETAWALSWRALRTALNERARQLATQESGA